MARKKKDDGYLRPPGPDPRASTLHWLQYGALRGFELLVAALPMPIVQALGTAIGRTVHLFDRAHRTYALINLDIAFGSRLSEQRKVKVVKDCYAHLGRALLETLRVDKITIDNYRDWVEIEGLDVFDKALDKGHGAILCTAHYGNWEIMNAVLGILDKPMSVMARPMDNPLVHDHLERIRTRTGNHVIYKHKSVRKLLTALRENRIVGIVNDQNVHDRNKIMVPFFGRDAATTPTPAAIAIKTGAPIITGYAVPLGAGRYLLRYDEAIEADPTADKDQEVVRITQHLNRRLEDQIERVPHCWFWVHKRYKSDMNGQTDTYRSRRRPPPHSNRHGESSADNGIGPQSD